MRLPIETRPVMSASTTGMIRWDHLIGLTGPLGLFEHALYDVPRPAHGYATDDNGRALVVIARASPEGVDPTPYLRHVVEDRKSGVKGETIDSCGQRNY